MEKEISTVELIAPQIEISYRTTVKPSQRFKIQSADTAYNLLLDTWDKTKIELLEQFKVILLNRANRVLGICTLTSGSAIGTIADPKQVFSVALVANATSVIIAHNHPSGSVAPSTADIELTRKMKAAGEVLELKLIDHVIVSTEGYYSFANEGTL